jgi:hypothetical protein
MSYLDIFAKEEGRLFSPPNGDSPQELPDYWRESPDKPVRTDLPELTDEELNALGWKGPIEVPPLKGTSPFTHSYKWNTETREYDATELDEFNKKRAVRYDAFWGGLINGVPSMKENGEVVRTSAIAYQRIKTASSQSLEINTLTTEFIALISDAKNGRANVEKIQQVLNDIISSIEFTAEELAEIQTAFIQSGMFAVYTLDLPAQ